MLFDSLNIQWIHMTALAVKVIVIFWALVLVESIVYGHHSQATGSCTDICRWKLRVILDLVLHLDKANLVTWLWQAGDMENLNTELQASYGPCHGLELPNHGIKKLDICHGCFDILSGYYCHINLLNSWLFKCNPRLQNPVKLTDLTLCQMITTGTL